MRSIVSLKESGKLADEDVENVTPSRIRLDKRARKGARSIVNVR